MLDNITIGNLRTNTNHPHPQVRGLMGITKNLRKMEVFMSLYHNGFQVTQARQLSQALSSLIYMAGSRPSLN